MRVMFALLYLSLGLHGASSCLPQDPRTLTIDQMERLVYAVAGQKGVSPAVVLNRIIRKVRYRQRTDKLKLKNNLQELAMQELLHPKHRTSSKSDTALGIPEVPGQSLARPTFPAVPPSRPASAPSFPVAGPNTLMTGVYLTPGFSSQEPSQSRTYPPQSYFIPIHSLRPPPGVTVRVEASAVDSGLLPEVTVTLSPMMTILEALKQAEFKYRSFLGTSKSEDPVMSFGRSMVAECYVIGALGGVRSGDRGYWKIRVSDKTGEVLYDSVCLPSRTEVAVKPGMTISLVYVFT